MGISLGQLLSAVGLVKDYADNKFTLENKETVDKLSTDNDGKLLFNGNPINSGDVDLSDYAKKIDLHDHTNKDVLDLLSISNDGYLLFNDEYVNDEESNIIYTNGATPFASSSYSTERTPDKLFDNDPSTAWCPDTLTFPHNVGITFAQPTYIDSYSITIGNIDSNDTTRAPKTWKLQGSNDGSTWDDIDTQSNITWSSSGLEKLFNLSNKAQYKSYRLYVIGNGSSEYRLTIANLKFFNNTKHEHINKDVLDLLSTVDDELLFNGKYISSDVIYAVSTDGATPFASSSYSTERTPDKLFDNDPSTAWMVSSNTYPHNVGITFAQPTTILKYSVTSRNYGSNDTNAAPKTWKLQGSNDGSTWDDIDTQSNITWSGSGEQKIFDLASVVTYKSYRLYITANNDSNYFLSFGGLKFYTSSKQYHTNQNVLDKLSESADGGKLLFDGKEIADAASGSGGRSQTTLWEGTANTAGDYTLSESIENYDEIIIYAAYKASTNYHNTHMVIPKNNYNIGSSTEFHLMSFIGDDGANNRLILLFNSNTSFTYDSRTSSNIIIRSIIGIK